MEVELTPLGPLVLKDELELATAHYETWPAEECTAGSRAFWCMDGFWRHECQIQIVSFKGIRGQFQSVITPHHSDLVWVGEILHKIVHVIHNDPLWVVKEKDWETPAAEIWQAVKSVEAELTAPPLPLEGAPSRGNRKIR